MMSHALLFLQTCKSAQHRDVQNATKMKIPAGILPGPKSR